MTSYTTAGTASIREAVASSSEQSDLSPLSEALASVGDRWTLLIVAALLDGPRRFGDLEKELQGIAPNVLSQRLRNLESQGLVRAERYSERPPRFVYELASSGRELAGALRLLADWGARHTGDVDPPRHSVCGTPLEAVWYCPTCEMPVEDQGAEEDVHYA